MTSDEEFPIVRRNGKSEAAFRTISEVSEELDVPQHVLRFWESKFPQVKPLKRGGGRRYYRHEDVGLLRRIRDLLYSEGYTIKGVQKLLKEGGVTKEGGLAETAPPASDVAEPMLPIEAADEAEPAEKPVVPVEADADAGGEDDMTDPDDDDDDDLLVGIFPAAVRHELEDILADLEALRGLLQPRER